MQAFWNPGDFVFLHRSNFGSQFLQPNGYDGALQDEVSTNLPTSQTPCTPSRVEYPSHSSDILESSRRPSCTWYISTLSSEGSNSSRLCRNIPHSPRRRKEVRRRADCSPFIFLIFLQTRSWKEKKMLKKVETAGYSATAILIK